jgi:hypothetical protein
MQRSAENGGRLVKVQEIIDEYNLNV